MDFRHLTEDPRFSQESPDLKTTPRTRRRPVHTGLLLAGWLILAFAGCTSIRTDTNPQAPIREKVRWSFQKQAIMVHVLSDRDLNESDKRAHTLIVGIVSVSDPNGFLPVEQDPDKAMEMLESGKKQDGILAVHRYIIPAGADQTVGIDRLRGALYLGIIAGYSDYDAKKDILLRPQPVRVKKSGMIFKTITYKPAITRATLVLGARHIKRFAISDNRKSKKKHPRRETEQSGKTPFISGPAVPPIRQLQETDTP